MDALYDRIGEAYTERRRADPRIAGLLERVLVGCRRVIDVGAGAGSYEPPSCVAAVEPSRLMIDQRPPGSAPAVRAVAEALPVRGGAVDGAMAILTVHHWSDPAAGLLEMRRVAHGPLAVLTCDLEVFADRFWLVRDYLPQALDAETDWAAPATVARLLGTARVAVVPVPHDCTDGFFGAYWRRPRSYLEPSVWAAISILARLDASELEAMADRLRTDLVSGAWASRHSDLLELEELDLGYRLVLG